MDRETRERIREERSRILIERREREKHIRHPPVLCVDCGCDMDAWTAGCRACNLRHYGRLRRGSYPGGRAAYERRVLEKLKVARSLQPSSGT